MVHYIILVPPQIIPFDFGEESVNEGDGVSVQCSVSKGDYPLNIMWSLNGKSIDTSEGVLIIRASKRVSSLSIDYVLESHAGNYTCIATNRATSAAYTTVLAVNGTDVIDFFQYIPFL